MTIVRKCPRCGSCATSRSHRKHVERLFVGFKPYRCNACQRRFFTFISLEQIRHSASRASDRKTIL